jgi:predicted RNase H-like HicB family nuclease
MTGTVSLEVSLQGYVRRDSARRWVASCPLIGVASQASTAGEARRCLQEAVELWFESCIERGVLEQALREANFRPSPSSPRSRRASGRARSQSPRGGVLGEPFPISLTIPGYEAPPLLGATA